MGQLTLNTLCVEVVLKQKEDDLILEVDSGPYP